MPVDEILRLAGYSLLLAGFLFIARWWAESKGKDRTARDRRIAIVLISASLVLTVAAMILE